MAAAAKIAELRGAKSAENAKKAEAEYAAGKKHASTGFLGLAKPDWERAARSFQESAKLYGLCGDAYSKALVDACLQCANAYEKQDQYHPAAQHYEKAAAECARTHDLKAAAQHFRSSARMYRLAEAPDKAAATYLKAANSVGDVDVKLAMELCSDACAVFEDEQRAMFAMDTFKAAINYMVKKGKYAEAIAMLYRQNKVYQMVMKTFENELYKNLLSILVLRFQTAEYETAEKEYKEFQSTAAFSTSSEAIASDALIDAWNQGSAEELAKATKLQTFTFLANGIAVLARKLAFDESKLKAAQASRAAADAKDQKEQLAAANANLPKNAAGELDLT